MPITEQTTPMAGGVATSDSLNTFRKKVNGLLHSASDSPAINPFDDSPISDEQGATVAAIKEYIDSIALPNVVQSVKTDVQFQASGSTAWVDISSLSVNITPRFSNSKIRISTCVMGSENGTNGNVTFRILRDASPIGIGDADGSATQVTFAGYCRLDREMFSASCDYIDSPATVSTITYKIQGRAETTSYAWWINQPQSTATTSDYARAISTITVEELLQ